MEDVLARPQVPRTARLSDLMEGQSARRVAPEEEAAP
jgi:hypothetical protein